MPTTNQPRICASQNCKRLRSCRLAMAWFEGLDDSYSVAVRSTSQRTIGPWREQRHPSVL
eukprot:2528854-Amphidinium_carterae.1